MEQSKLLIGIIVDISRQHYLNTSSIHTPQSAHGQQRRPTSATRSSSSPSNQAQDHSPTRLGPLLRVPQWNDVARVIDYVKLDRELGGPLGRPHVSVSSVATSPQSLTSPGPGHARRPTTAVDRSVLEESLLGMDGRASFSHTQSLHASMDGHSSTFPAVGLSSPIMPPYSPSSPDDDHDDSPSQRRRRKKAKAEELGSSASPPQPSIFQRQKERVLQTSYAKFVDATNVAQAATASRLNQTRTNIPQQR